MKTTSIDGATIRYEDQGQGDALLFLHAFPLGLAMWDEQARALSASYRVLRFDMRGFGGSPPADGPLTMDRIADDAAAVLDHAGVDRAVVIGLSMGGYAAFSMVRRHPGRLRALALCNTRPGADTEEGRRGRAELADKVRREGARVAAEAMAPKLLGESTQQERPEVGVRLAEIILGNPPEGIAAALEGMALRIDSTETLGSIAVPTLIVVGDEDKVTPVAEAEFMQGAIPGSRLEIIPRAGHLSNLESPDGFNAVLSSFLQSLS